MKKNFFKGAALAALALAGFTATAQEESTSVLGIDLSGSVDTYFRANLNAPNDEAQFGPGTSFANSSGFSLGMANLIASKQVGKVGFVADLVFGPRGEEAVFGSGPSSNIVNQLYVTLQASDALTFTMGNFNTFLGYEVISPTGNFNYSTSYMFSYGPFSHTGLKADFAIDDNWSAMLAVMNPTDVTEFNPVGNYVLGAQLGYSADNGSAFLNFRYGSEIDEVETFQVDLTTGWDLTDDFYLGVNATYLTGEDAGFDDDGEVAGAGFYGVALYPQYSLSESFTLGLRAEYFATYNGGLVSFDGTDVSSVLAINDTGDGSVIAATLTGSWTKGALTIKPELRLDSMAEDDFPVYFDNDGEDTKSLASFVVGAIYAF